MKTLAEAAGHPEFIRLAAMWDIVAATMEGHFGQAEELAGELGRRLDQIGHSQAQLISVAQSASWRLLQGYATEYIAPFEALSAADPGNLAYPAITAWCLAEAGAGDRAAELLGRIDPASAADADKNYLWWAVIVGFSGAVDLVGDRRWAEALYELAAPYAGSNCTLGLASFLGAADHWLGVLATAAGRYNEASRAPRGGADEAPRDGRTAVDGAHRGGLRAGAVAARPARGHRAGGRAHRVRDAHRRRTRAGRDRQPAAAARLTATARLTTDPGGPR